MLINWIYYFATVYAALEQAIEFHKDLTLLLHNY